MQRFNFFIEKKWLEKLKKNMGEYGFYNVSSFLRYIIIKFFENKKQ